MKKFLKILCYGSARFFRDVCVCDRLMLSPTAAFLYLSRERISAILECERRRAHVCAQDAGQYREAFLRRNLQNRPKQTKMNVSIVELSYPFDSEVLI